MIITAAGLETIDLFSPRQFSWIKQTLYTALGRAQNSKPPYIFATGPEMGTNYLVRCFNHVVIVADLSFLCKSEIAVVVKTHQYHYKLDVIMENMNLIYYIDPLELKAYWRPGGKHNKCR